MLYVYGYHIHLLESRYWTRPPGSIATSSSRTQPPIPSPEMRTILSILCGKDEYDVNGKDEYDVIVNLIRVAIDFVKKKITHTKGLLA